VAFQQLYYTSCEHGLGGYGGYQFNAVTPGTDPGMLREVEERTVYEPPRWLQAEPAPDDPEAYPVAFSYGISEASGVAIAAQVVFAGTDYSGRPGNYFVHALATGTPEEDFGPVLPAELWGAALWQQRPVDRTELPELPGPPPRGNIDRAGAQAFLEARGAHEVLPELLTAVGQALSGQRPVVLVSEDATENAWWIAAVSYLLGEPLARRLTFTTYSHRPGYSRYHLTGVLPDTLLPDADTSLMTFDFAAGRTPRAGTHPLAAILAGTGVMACAGLWQQAVAFASGAEAALDDWLAPVALAAGLLGRTLAAAEASAVARWLPAAAQWLSPQLCDVALGIMLGQPLDGGQPDGGKLDDGQLGELLELARRLPAAARAEDLERLLIGRAVAHITRGEQATPVRLTTRAGPAARERVAQILTTATPAVALAVLKWADACGVELPEPELERYGRERLEVSVGQGELARLIGAHPAILRGLLERLAGEPPEVTREVLGGPVGARLRRDDLARYPELTELWLVQSVARKRVKPLRAFDEIVDIRAAADRSPLVDGTLLRLLWPDGCPPDQLTELLGTLTDPTAPDVTAPDVTDWFATEIARVPGRGTTSRDWHRLAQALADHPILSQLPPAQTQAVRNAVRILPLLEQAGSGHDTTVFAELFRAWDDADADTRRLLAAELPARLARASPLAAALRGCPPAVAQAFGREVAGWLAITPADVDLARRVFTAMVDPGLAAVPALSDPLAGAFDQVGGWRRRDLGTLAQSWPDDSPTGQAFRVWRDARRGPLARKLLGGPSS
jgi:hypothetical protein